MQVNLKGNEIMMAPKCDIFREISPLEWRRQEGAGVDGNNA